MKKQNELSAIIQSILITHFQISEQDFDWNTPLYELNENFKLYSYLEDFEQLLSDVLEKEVVLVEKVNAFIHTPKQVVTFLSSK